MHQALRLAVVGAGLAWWLPAIAVLVGRLAAARLRFSAVMAWGDALRAMGRLDAARRLYAAEMARCERQRRALAGRRGW